MKQINVEKLDSSRGCCGKERTILAVLSKAPDALSLNRAAGNEPIGTGKEPAQYA